LALAKDAGHGRLDVIVYQGLNSSECIACKFRREGATTYLRVRRPEFAILVLLVTAMLRWFDGLTVSCSRHYGLLAVQVGMLPHKVTPSLGGGDDLDQRCKGWPNQGGNYKSAFP